MRCLKVRNSSLIIAMMLISTAHADQSIRDLNWLTGHWCSQRGAQQIEEYWLPASGDMMLGVGRTVRGDKTLNFEFFRIAYHEQTLSYFAQPQGQAETIFKRVDGNESWLRFENTSHDFPTRVEYRRVGDKLLASIAGPGKDGKEKIIAFDYLRCAP